MNEALKYLGFIISFASLGLTIATIALPDWRVNDVEGEVVELIERTQGLWVKCAFFPTGNWQCEDYDRFFIALPAAITGARVFSILSLLFQVVSICAQPFGMMCTTIIPLDQTATKAKVTLGSGFLNILAGVCIGVAVSWYAALVVEDYSRFTTGQNAGIETAVQRFIYGTALYTGWSAMSLLIVQGAILCCSSWGGEEYHHGYEGAPMDPYSHQSHSHGHAYSGYNQPKHMMGGTEYI